MTENDPQYDPGNDPENGPGLDPEQDAHLRALLAEVGAEEEPIPAEVTARLDDVLAGLRAERVDQPEQAGQDQQGEQPEHATQADVVPLRRRWLPRAAGAAAAVIVLGVGGVAALRLATDEPASQDSAASGGAASDTTTLPQSSAKSSPESSPQTPTPSAGSGVSPGAKARELQDSAKAVKNLPALTTAAFADDVTGLLRRDAALVTPAELSAEGQSGDSGSDSGSPQTTQQSRADARLAQACPGPSVDDGAAANPVRIDGELAVLLVHPPEDGEQLVEAWTCGGERRLDSTQVQGADITP